MKSDEQKTRGIVLRTVKVGDTKLIVDLLTREGGRLSVFTKVSSSASGRMRRQMFQPLTVLDLDIRRSPRQQMALIDDMRIALPYSSIPLDGVKMSLVFFLAEFLSLTTRDMQPDRNFYDFIEQSLEWLDSSSRGLANFHLMMMMRMSAFLGFYPDITDYSPGCCFDLREGRFVVQAPFHTDFLKQKEAEDIRLLMRMNHSNLHLFRFTREERRRIIDVILHFYRLHIPGFNEMKTLEILRAM